MSTFFEVHFSYLEPVSSVATVEGDSPDDAVVKIRNYFQHAQDLEIQLVTPLESTPSEVTPKGKPNLRLVN